MLATSRQRRPWGRWTVLDKGKGYKVKKIEVLSGHRLSLQKHHYRSEHWAVVEGKARVMVNKKNFILKANEHTFVPKGALHRLANAGKEKLVVIEVQEGSYVGEDDILRIEDDYGRI